MLKKTGRFPIAFIAALAVAAPLSGACAQAAVTFASAKPGDIVTLPAELFSAPTVQREITPSLDQSQLLLSDNPESVTADGILLRETVKPGNVRVYLYNVISGPAPKAVPIAVTNVSSDTLSLQFSRCARTAPGTDYNRAAQKVMYDLLAGTPKKCDDIALAPGASALLDPELQSVSVSSDQLTHGIYEFSVDTPARITVFAHELGKKSLEVLPSLPVLPRNETGAGRGLFPVSNFVVGLGRPYSTLDGPRALVLADGKDDPWLKGTDSLSSAQLVNDGNYGAMYKITVPYATPDGRGFVVALANPRSPDKYCTYLTAAMTVSSRQGYFDDATVALPAIGGDMLAAPPHAAIIAIVPPLPLGKIAGTLNLLYSPPGAACLPDPIIFIPI
jgi:hypothetical protein